MDPISIWQFDEAMMQQAIREAGRALESEDVPVGAVIVHEGNIIGRGHNQRERLSDPTAHAEMIALTAAASALNSWRLIDCTLYVTLEPCAMCAGAIVLARLPRVVYGADDPKAGAGGSVFNLLQESRLNHQAEVVRGVLADESSLLLRDFFATQRAKGKK